MLRENGAGAPGRQRRAQPETAKVDPALRPLEAFDERSIDLWVVNPREICVEGSISEVRAVVGSAEQKHLFAKDGSSLFGEFLDLQVLKTDSRDEPQCLRARFPQEYQGCLLHKAITVYYKEKISGTSRKLRSYFIKNK